MQKQPDQLIPVYIRPQLIPFLFKESEGNEAGYMNKTVKSVMIYPFGSIGKFIYSQLNSHKKLGRKDKFIIYLTIDRKSLNYYHGYIYVEINKVKDKLYLPETNVNSINNLIEDMFRIGFVYYVDGCVENNEENEVRRAVDKFIDKYDLLEVGYSNETLRRLYYREKKKNHKLSRFQQHSSNRVLNFEE